MDPAGSATRIRAVKPADRLVIIPARGGSKRLPRKNVRLLLGAPLMAYAIHAARSACRVDRIVVSTDDAEIAAVSREWGADVIARPASISQDHSPVDEALRHAVDVVAGETGHVPSIAVWLQPDVPIRQAGMIDAAIEILEARPDISGAATGYRVWQHPAWMKTLDDDGIMAPYAPEIAAFRTQDLPTLFMLDGAVVAFRSETLRSLTQVGVHLYLGERARLLEQPHAMYSLNIDTPEQFDLAEMYLSRFPAHQVRTRPSGTT